VIEGLARLFQDNVWKLHRLLENIVLDRGPQFVAELTKELNRCYDLKLKGLSNKTTLVLSNTREFDRVPSTK